MELSVPDYVILIVEDLDRTLDFYTQVLGLRLGHRAGEYAQMETGTTRLGFYTRTAMAQAVGLSLKQPAPDAVGFEIGFKSDSMTNPAPPVNFRRTKTACGSRLFETVKILDFIALHPHP